MCVCVKVDFNNASQLTVAGDSYLEAVSFHLIVHLVLANRTELGLDVQCRQNLLASRSLQENQRGGKYVPCKSDEGPEFKAE